MGKEKVKTSAKPRWRRHRHWRHGTRGLYNSTPFTLFGKKTLTCGSPSFLAVAAAVTVTLTGFSFFEEATLPQGSLLWWRATSVFEALGHKICKEQLKKLFICINQTELFSSPLHPALTFDNNGSNCIINRCKPLMGQGSLIVSTFLTIIAWTFFNWAWTGPGWLGKLLKVPLRAAVTN